MSSDLAKTVCDRFGIPNPPTFTLSDRSPLSTTEPLPPNHGVKRSPIYIAETGTGDQIITLKGFPDAGSLQQFHLPLNATLQDLIAQLGPGEYEFHNLRSFSDKNIVLADFPLTRDPWQWKRKLPPVRPVMVTKPSDLVQTLICYVVLPDTRQLEVRVEANATVSDAVNAARSMTTLKAEYRITRDGEETLSPDFRVCDLSAPREIWLEEVKYGFTFQGKTVKLAVADRDTVRVVKDLFLRGRGLGDSAVAFRYKGRELADDEIFSKVVNARVFVDIVVDEIPQGEKEPPKVASSSPVAERKPPASIVCKLMLPNAHEVEVRVPHDATVADALKVARSIADWKVTVYTVTADTGEPLSCNLLVENLPSSRKIWVEEIQPLV